MYVYIYIERERETYMCVSFTLYVSIILPGGAPLPEHRELPELLVAALQRLLSMLCYCSLFV